MCISHQEDHFKQWEQQKQSYNQTVWNFLVVVMFHPSTQKSVKQSDCSRYYKNYHYKKEMKAKDLEKLV